MRIPIIALPLGLAVMALAGSAGMAQEIGAAGAVNPATAGTPPGRPTRVIELGARVIHKERIQTTWAARCSSSSSIRRRSTSARTATS